MATTIKLKNSVTTTATPSTLVQGEAAVNITDKKVWVGDASSTPVQILGAGATVAGTTGTFTGNVSVAGTFSANGGATLGDASGDALTINSSAVSIPNGLNFDSNTLVIDATNNRVGIGQASPSSTLHVKSSGNNFKFETTAVAGANYGTFINGSGDMAYLGYTSTDTNFVINNTLSGAMRFLTSNTERMRIDSSGNVGIGTSSPASYSGYTTLDIDSSTNGGLLNIKKAGSTIGYINGFSGMTVLASSGQNLQLTAAGANNILFNTSATERMRLDSSGNLGLGVTPSAWRSTNPAFQVGQTGSLFAYSASNIVGFANNLFINSAGDEKYITSSTAGYYRINGNAHQWFNAPSGTAGNTATLTQAMTLDASGNLGVGTTSPATKLQVNASSGYVESRVSSGTNDVGLAIDGSTAYLAVFDAIPLTFQTNSTERMRIDSSGNLLVGTTDSANNSGSGIKLKPAGNGSNAPILALVTTGSTSASANFQVYSTTAAAYRFYVNDAGTIYATSTTISAISDQRLKENVRDLDVGLSEIMSLQPRKFDWKEGKGLDKKDDVGFIAQEFETVFPNSVTTSMAGADGVEYKTVNHSELIPTLVKAIQELKAEVDSLKAQLNK